MRISKAAHPARSPLPAPFLHLLLISLPSSFSLSLSFFLRKISLSRQGFVDDFRLRTFTFAFYRVCSRSTISSLKECVSGRDNVSNLTFLRHLSPSLHILRSLELLGSLGVRVRPVTTALVYFSVSLF